MTDDRPPETRAIVIRGQSAPASATRSFIAAFQPDALELEASEPSRTARVTLYLVAALIVGAVIWATLSTVDEVVVAPGRLITTRPSIVVQPLETSVIRSIDVTVGEVVRAGQTLARLDATFAQSDADQLRARHATYDAQVRRLTAELNDRDAPGLAERGEEGALQARLLLQRRAYLASQLTHYARLVEMGKAEMAKTRAEERALVKRSANLGEIVTMHATLVERQTGSRLRYLLAQDTRLNVETDLVKVRGAKVAAEQSVAKAQAEQEAFIQDYRRAAMEELVEAERQRAAASEELKKMERRRDLVVLTAPADAVVLEMADRSVGSVVREAEPLLTLTPLDIPLEGEISIDARDIGRIHAGQSVRIKFDAYPFQKHGTATGSLRTISEDAFAHDRAETPLQAERPSSFYRARVSLDVVDLKQVPAPIRLIPGMNVTAEIMSGRRSVASYFLYPLIRGFDESIREP